MDAVNLTIGHMRLPLPVSLTMVVCNEAHRLGPMLNWHRNLVSQIVVVVQQSDDQTLQIASELADIAITHPRHGYCEASRAAASGAAAFDCQLILDADEHLTIAGLLGMPYMLEAMLAGEVDGWRLRRTFWRDGQHEFTGDAHHRLVHRERVRFLNEIHTEPQTISGRWSRVPTFGGDHRMVPAIWHVKSTNEQLADERRCQALLSDGGALERDPLRKQKLALNVHLERDQ